MAHSYIYRGNVLIALGQTPNHSPSVILSVEQEVRANDGDTHGHNAEDDQDQHHEPVHVVDFVGPERREDEVPEERGQSPKLRRSANNIHNRRYRCKNLHFNENGAERKDSSEADDDSGLHEPDHRIKYECLRQTPRSGA